MEPQDLTLEERCRLLGGATTWRTHEIGGTPGVAGEPESGGSGGWVPAIRMTDGPNGARGERSGPDGVPGVAIPVGIALGATWDPDLVGRLGGLLGVEAQRRSAHVLLAPTVNIVRTPIGGRTFECYSEDAELTARLAVAFVRGVQSHDVAVTVKHFVGNDTEIERSSVDARIPEDALREIYLRPFEAAVLEAGAWGVMAAYNRLDGDFCAENPWLLIDTLREEWGFDGFVASDWGGAHDTVAAGIGGLSVAMPGPRTIFGAPLADAVRAGKVDEASVDARVAEVLRLVERTHADTLGVDRPGSSVDDPAERALCREAAASSTVLLRNAAGVLPLDPSSRVAVIGPNAARTRIMGGGSSSLRPLAHRSILDSLLDRLGDARGGGGSGVVSHSVGTSIEKHMPVIEAAELRRPDGGEGLLVEYRNGEDPDGPVVATATTAVSAFTSFGLVPDGVTDTDVFRATLIGEIVPSVTGRFTLGAMLTGKGRVVVGDAVVLDDPERRLPRGDWLFGYSSEEQTATVDLVAGEAVPVSISTTGLRGLGAVRLGAVPVDPPPLMDEAVEAAAAADVSIVVVGTSDEWETEGVDRTTISLPGDQDELVTRVAAASDRTVVVVNAGGPVAMPWIDQVDAVVVVSFAGIETGPALAEVLAGDTDPGGRLPVTYPVRLEDCPAWPHYRPVDGVQTYGEGRFVGYRGHERSGVEPLFPFGHGLSYGTSEWGGFSLSSCSEGDGRAGTGASVTPDGSLTVHVTVTNTGDRDVTDVVQAYVTPSRSAAGSPELPAKSLAGFAKCRLGPGETAELEIGLGPESWRRWDESAHRWTVDAGGREVVIAASAAEERARLPFRVAAPGDAAAGGDGR